MGRRLFAAMIAAGVAAGGGALAADATLTISAPATDETISVAPDVLAVEYRWNGWRCLPAPFERTASDLAAQYRADAAALRRFRSYDRLRDFIADIEVKPFTVVIEGGSVTRSIENCYSDADIRVVAEKLFVRVDGLLAANR
ncbi:MAG: hypothetical protein VYB54_00380 [Pseudomonadota bacterium]|nr:hypothetical protein [Pseudomonadota bacterium]